MPTLPRIFLLVFLLAILGSGCAPKVVIQPSPPVRVPPTSPLPTVSSALRQQFLLWQGVPHRIGGMDRQGVDCSGLMQIVFRDAFQISLPRTSGEQSRWGRNVHPVDMAPGDLLFFIDKGRDHIGVLVERGIFLHVSALQGVMLSNLDAYWLPRLQRVQRVLP